ncbi:hypothetical protein JJV70_15215 [Streptomyces sp. JJ66]|uniref:hypothetical protein n=1 Tax=Streptomyces sp. JJ66 TaxID=2803843 RepID=UPI001C579763|nr:hypothetical protein [Streptomyces sp. JJ66]MBW1603429.1 hypothetical protein [Streptomyces sp. JJ66]
MRADTATDDGLDALYAELHMLRAVRDREIAAAMAELTEDTGEEGPPIVEALAYRCSGLYDAREERDRARRTAVALENELAAADAQLAAVRAACDAAHGDAAHGDATRYVPRRGTYDDGALDTARRIRAALDTRELR